MFGSLNYCSRPVSKKKLSTSPRTLPPNAEEISLPRPKRGAGWGALYSCKAFPLFPCFGRKPACRQIILRVSLTIADSRRAQPSGCYRACALWTAASRQYADLQEVEFAGQSRRVLERRRHCYPCVRREGAGKLSGTVQSSRQEQLHGQCHLCHSLGQSCANSHGASGRREQILRQFLQ